MQYIDSTNKIPLYLQLKTMILDKINAGEWEPGHMLPTESDFQDMLGVSRATVRHALEDLEHEGYIIKKQGKGTFIAPEKLSYHLPKLTSFSEDMRQKGYVPGSITLELEIIRNEAVAEKMNMPPQADILYMHRLRTLGGEILGLHDAYFNLALLDGESIKANIESGALKRGIDRDAASFYSILEHRYGIRISYADEFLEAIACPLAIAHFLGVSANAPVIFLERITHTDNDDIIEYVKMYNRADMYKYSIRLTR